jgi:hypothetical protein
VVERLARINIDPCLWGISRFVMPLNAVTNDAPAVSRAHEFTLAGREADGFEQLDDLSLLPAFVAAVVVDDRKDHLLPDLLPFEL